MTATWARWLAHGEESMRALQAVAKLRADWGDGAVARAEALAKTTVHSTESACQMVDQAEYLRAKDPEDLDFAQGVRLWRLEAMGA
jgi:hypothetical protein